MNVSVLQTFNKFKTILLNIVEQDILPYKLAECKFTNELISVGKHAKGGKQHDSKSD